ncbi:hypothetical protein AVEN_162026-1 [Araneus ventricosus]|uniref:Uncharacterized protein n=1 Tax=Araneus ventricosus TaxID=182803 RepID=A0A4Y2F6U3_ARAVE|nr:hypothetical protein AVEN_162026-1 [Araneus ventricosus]
MSGSKGSRFETRFHRRTAESDLVHANSAEAKCPRVGVVRKFGEGLPDQVSFSSSDSGSNLQCSSQNRTRVAVKWDEQYRNDCNIAVRLLQCKPSSFVAHKFNSLPADFQAKVKRHLSRPPRASSSSLLLDQCPPDVRTIKVSVPTLPPAAMVYSVNKSTAQSSNVQPTPAANNTEEVTPDHVSAAIIAKVLEERSLERKTAASMKKQRFMEENRDLDLRNVAIQTDCSRPIVCRCQHSLKYRSMLPDCETIRTSKEQNTSNSTETAI